MSLMDDIFDVEHALKDDPKAKTSFENIIDYLNRMEEYQEAYLKLVTMIQEAENGIAFIESIRKEKLLFSRKNNNV